jgi:hypothetical protein
MLRGASTLPTISSRQSETYTKTLHTPSIDDSNPLTLPTTSVHHINVPNITGIIGAVSAAVPDTNFFICSCCSKACASFTSSILFCKESDVDHRCTSTGLEKQREHQALEQEDYHKGMVAFSKVQRTAVNQRRSAQASKNTPQVGKNTRVKVKQQQPGTHLQDKNVFKHHNFHGCQVLARLWLGARLVPRNQQQSSVHHGSSVEHSGHKNIVARAIDERHVSEIQFSMSLSCQ